VVDEGREVGGKGEPDCSSDLSKEEEEEEVGREKGEEEEEVGREKGEAGEG